MGRDVDNIYFNLMGDPILAIGAARALFFSQDVERRVTVDQYKTLYGGTPMPVKRYGLNGHIVRSIDDFYDQLESGLLLPERFGRNLDALWDVLSEDVEGPFEIVWKNSADSKAAMGRDFERIVKLFQDLEEERDDFQFTIE